MNARIRRATLRAATTSALTFGSVGLLAGAAFAQYPPANLDVIVTTPGATIQVGGYEFGPNTDVVIIFNTPAGPQRTTATANDDGEVTADFTVPDDADGEIQYTIEGVDAAGEAREQAGALNVQLTGVEALPDVLTVEEDGQSSGLALGLTAAGIAAVAGATAAVRRRATPKADA